MDQAVRAVIAVLLVASGSFIVSAQPYLNRLLDFNGYEVGGGVIVVDSFYYIYGISGPPMIKDGFLAKVDLDGDTIWVQKVPVDSLYTWNTSQGLLIKSSDSSLIIGGAIRVPGLSGYYNHFSSWNTDGDTLWLQIWGQDSLNNIPRSMISIGDGLVSIFGSRYNPSTIRGGVFYTMLDSSGSILKDTMLTGFDYFDDPSSATLLPNGNMAVLFRRNKLVPYPDDYDIVVLEVTVDGEVVRQVEFDTPYRAWGAGITMDRNKDNIILTGTVEIQPYWPSGMIIKAYLAVLDTQFTVLFDTIIGYEQLNHVSLWNHVIAGNGDIIFVGAASVGGNNPKDQAWIFRADSTYNIEWSRIYSSNYSHHNYLYDLKEDRVGHLVAVGSGYGQTQDLWIIRTDSAGCMVPNCDSLTWAGPALQPFAVKLYPNPFGSQFTIELPPAATLASVSVFDLSGRIVYFAPNTSGMQHITAHAWPAGIYLVQVATEAGLWHGKVVKVE